MSLLKRKARPLQRDQQTYRDDRLFIVACDDTYAPDQYFKFFGFPRVHVKVVPAMDNDSHASQVLARLKTIDYQPDDQRWLLLDTDHCIKNEHLKNFTAALAEAKQDGIQVALSKPCFELWLLLHHVETNAVGALKNASEVEQALAKVLGTYDKTNLKKEHFPLSSVVLACQRARQLDGHVTGGDIPQANTSRVYLLWQAIVESVPLTQLSEELHQLKNSGKLAQ